MLSTFANFICSSVSIFLGFSNATREYSIDVQIKSVPNLVKDIYI